jgi:hypothetical protein
MTHMVAMPRPCGRLTFANTDIADGFLDRNLSLRRRRLGRSAFGVRPLARGQRCAVADSISLTTGPNHHKMIGSDFDRLRVGALRRDPLVGDAKGVVLGWNRQQSRVLRRIVPGTGPPVFATRPEKTRTLAMLVMMPIANGAQTASTSSA